MDDHILRHYGILDASADSWSIVDATHSENALPNFELDALGTGQSVSKVLYDRGILRSDIGVPAEYSLASKAFDSRAYVRNVHRKATQTDLLRGQEYLKTNVDSKAGSLKVLVEDNFDRFVGSKRIIDNVNSQIAVDFSKSDDTSKSRLDSVKKTLNDTSIRATQIFEPVIENQRRADRLRATLSILEQYSAHFDLPSLLLRCIDNNDNESLLKEYKKGQILFKDVRNRNGTMSAVEERNNSLLGRAWNEVEKIIKTRQTHFWALLEKQTYVDNEATAKLANFLLELGVESNPYYRAYHHHNSHVREMTPSTLQINRIRIEILRRNLVLKHVDNQLERLEALATFVQSEVSPSESVPNILQSADILTFWGSIEHLIDDVWSGPVASLVENWKIVQDMTNTRTVKLLPNGPEGSSRKFHTFTKQEHDFSIEKTEETIELLCNSLTDFFVSRPLTALPAEHTNGGSSVGVEFSQSLPDLGERELAEFSFIAPAVNSLGACLYLNKVMSNIMAGVSQLHSLKISSKADDLLQKMVAVVRERLIRAICELWQSDSDDLPHLETWNRASSTTDGTDFPKAFWIMQKAIIDGVARIMFRNELMPLPSQRLLGNVRQQFVKNVYQVINGLMTLSYSVTISPLASTQSSLEPEVKKLLTITNLQAIESSTLLKLVQTLESTFAISLTADLQKIKSMFAQYTQKLTTSFLTPRLAALDDNFARNLHNINWLDVPFPQDISPWTSECILECVTTHALVSTRAPSLLKSLLDQMIQHIFETLYNYVQRSAKFSGAAMLQVTLDLEFTALQFGDSLPDSAKTKIDEIFAIVKAGLIGDKVEATDKGEVKRILGRATRRWSVQGNVFRGPLLAAPTRR